jgi:alpha-glucosidase
MQSLIQSTSEKPTDTLFLHVYKGDQQNSFVYYEDDGESFDNEKGVYYQRKISYHPADKKIILEKADGSYVSRFHHIKLLLHGFGDQKSITVNGSALPLIATGYSFLSPISRFDPQGSSIPAERCTVQQATFDNGNQLINVDL